MKSASHAEYQDSPHRLHWVWILLVAVLAAAPRLAYIHAPFDRDEGTFAYSAQVISHGGLPYRDVFDQKPPLIFFIYWLAIKIFGVSIAAPRFVGIIFVGVAAYLLTHLVWKLTADRFASIAVTLLFGLSLISPGYSGVNTNTELFTLPFIIGGLTLCLSSGRRWRDLFLAGLLFGCGFMIKQPVGIVAASLLSFFIVMKFRHQVFRAALTAGLGFFLPLFGLVLLYIIRGSWSFFLEAWRFGLSYVSNFTWVDSFIALLQSLNRVVKFDPAIWLIGLACALWFIRQKNIRGRGWLVVLWLSSLISIAVGKRFYGHYYYFMLPPLALGIGITIGSIPAKSRRRFKIALVCLWFVLTSFFWMARGTAQDPWSTTSYGWGPWFESGKLTLSVPKAIGDYLHYQSETGHTAALIVGSEPEILFYAQMTSPTRFIFFSQIEQASPYQKEHFRQEMENDVDKRMPDYLILPLYSLSPEFADVTYNLHLLKKFSSYRLIAFASPSYPKINANPEMVWSDPYLLTSATYLIFTEPAVNSPRAGQTVPEFLDRFQQ